jgi:predicted nucleotidyltransferase
MTLKLKGKNRIEEFRRIAKALVSKISKYDGVAGIAFIGGLVRGFADEYSDLDIEVLLSIRDEKLRKQLYKLSSSVAKRCKVDIDMEVHFLEDFKKRKWNEVDRWEFSKAEIVFDPEGMLKKVIDEKLVLPESFWINRIVVHAEHMKWYCCPPRENVGTVAENWIDRGDLQSAHHCLNYATDVMLKILFALNREHLPAPKWQLFYSRSLKWLPEGYEGLIGDAMRIRNYSLKEFKFRLQALRKMWRSVLPKIEAETRLTVDQIPRYFVKNILRVSV